MIYMKLINKIFIYIVKFYQIFISPFLGSHCRYTPTCSSYCIQCFKKHNTIYALYLTVKRLVRCNPFGGSGHDPVP